MITTESTLSNVQDSTSQASHDSLKGNAHPFALFWLRVSCMLKHYPVVWKSNNPAQTMHAERLASRYILKSSFTGKPTACENLNIWEVKFPRSNGGWVVRRTDTTCKNWCIQSVSAQHLANNCLPKLFNLFICITVKLFDCHYVCLILTV